MCNVRCACLGSRTQKYVVIIISEAPCACAPYVCSALVHKAIVLMIKHLCSVASVSIYTLLQFNVCACMRISPVQYIVMGCALCSSFGMAELIK